MNKIVFDKSSPAFYVGEPEKNLYFIRQMEHWVNDLLKVRGSVELARIYFEFKCYGFNFDQWPSESGWIKYDENRSFTINVDSSSVETDSIELEFHYD